MKQALISLALMLTACNPAPPQPETTPSPNPVFETQIRAMEKAKAVEEQMQDAAEARRKAMDATTQ